MVDDDESITTTAGTMTISALTANVLLPDLHTLDWYMSLLQVCGDKLRTFRMLCVLDLKVVKFILEIKALKQSSCKSYAID